MKEKKIAFLFPGQGSQYCGMGKDFCESFTSAKQIFEEADDLLNRSLSQIVFDGPLDILTETRNSQTGIYVTSLAILKVLQDQFPTLAPSVCAGLSLGEYTALTASQRLTFKQGLPLVQSRGEYMNEACIANKGTMAAILGLSAEQVESLVKEANIPQDLWIANFNAPGQVVISGTIKGVEQGMELAKAKGAKRTLPLQVQGAFHSGLMSYAEDRLKEKIYQISLKESPIDLVMNVPGDFVVDLKKIQDYMIRQVTNPVRWEQGIRAMNNIDFFIEIGCGKTLAGMNRQMGITVPTISISKVEDLETLAGYLI